jgi:hypothetical protein
LAQSLVLTSTQLGERVHLHWPCLYKHAIRRHSTCCRLFGTAAQHALQDVSSKHYDRYDYLPEKRQAMQTWGGYLQAVIAGSKAVPMQGANTA